MTQFAGGAAATAFRPSLAVTTAGSGNLSALAAGGLISGGIIAAQIGLSYAFPNVTRTEGRRIGEIPLGFTAEGAPIPLSFGPLNRLAGTFIYASRLKETKLVEEIDTSGISSGDYQELTTYNYTVDLAIAIGEGVINNVTKIWADGTPIYRFIDARPEQTGTTLSIEKISFFGGFLPVIMRLKSSTNAIDLTLWTRPSLIDITGFANFANNVVAGLVVRVFVDPDDANITYLDIFNPLAVTEAQGATVTIVQSFSQVPGFVFFRKKTAKNITIYKGNDTQVADANLEASRLLETILTNTPLPAFRNIAYVAFNDLELGQFQNRIPRLEFLVEKATSQTLGDSISTLLQRGGIPTRNIDVSDIQDTSISGYTIYGPVAMANAILTLIQAFNLIAFEVDGKLTFKHRENATVIALTATELAAHSIDGDAPRALDLTDIASFNLPKTINVNYFGIGNDYQKTNQQERRINATVDTNLSVDFPITMTTAKASEIASRILWAAWTNRQSVSFTLPPSRITLNETEVVTVTSGGNKFRILLSEIKRGHDFRLECIGFIESIEALNFIKTVDSKPDIGIVDKDPTGDSLIALGFIDIAPFHNSHVNTSGVYFSLANYDRDDDWEGGQIYIGTTDKTDTGLSLAADIPNESTMGFSTTFLANGLSETIDVANTVTIELFNGTLTNKTLSQVFEGQNVALLGDEIIGFQTVTLVSGTKYTLSNLLRGLRGTQSKTSTHAINDRFIPLITGNIAYFGISSGLLNIALGIKATSTNGVLADVPLHTHTFIGGSATPFAPATVRGVRAGDDAITTTWERVTTSLWKQFGAQPFPNNEFGNELYTVEYRSVGDVLLRTETNVGPTRSDVYTNAEQTSDAGVTPGDTIKVEVFHQGTLITKGPGTQITVI